MLLWHSIENADEPFNAFIRSNLNTPTKYASGYLLLAPCLSLADFSPLSQSYYLKRDTGFRLLVL